MGPLERSSSRRAWWDRDRGAPAAARPAAGDDRGEGRNKRLVVPTAAEVLRIKAWLALNRNQTRDYLDIAALADAIGLDEAAAVLSGIDDYYADINRRPEAVSSQIARQLADPRPRDAQVTRQLASYKSLEPRWHDWATVTAVLADLAERMTR